MKISKKISYSLLYSSALVVLYMFLLVSIFPNTYWANDNIGILHDIKMGCKVHFMSFLLGELFLFCYHGISDNIPWYALFLYCVLGASLAILLHSLHRVCSYKYATFTFIFVVFILSALFVLRIGYNGVSILSGTTSLFAYFVYLRSSSKPHWGIVLMLGVMFSVSYLVRKSGFSAVLVFAAPIMVFELLKKLRKNTKLVLLFLLPSLLIITTNSVLEKTTLPQEEIAFKKWNHLRGRLHGYPIQKSNKENSKILVANNWSDNDYEVFSNWTFIDENKYNQNTIDNIFRYSTPTTTMQILSFERVHGAVKDAVKAGRIGRYLFPIFVLLPMTMLIAFFYVGHRQTILPLLYVFYILMIEIYMLLFFRFPVRIAYPLVLCCLLWTFFLCFCGSSRKPPKQPRYRFLPALSIALLFISGIFFATLVLEEIQQVGQEQKKYHAFMEQIENYNPDFYLGLGFRKQYQNPLQAKINNERNNIPLGWTVFSPRFYKVLSGLGLEHGYDVFPKMIDNEKALLIGDSRYIDRIRTFIYETYGITCQSKIVFQMVDGINSHLLVSSKN